MPDTVHPRTARAGDGPLAAARARFEELVESLDAIVWEMDAATWQFTYVSRRAEDLLGYPVERWLQEPGFWADVILHRGDRDWAVEFCTRSTQESRDHTFEYRARAADGRVVWLHDLVRVVRNEDGGTFLRGVMVDITERKAAEQALREREQNAALSAAVALAVSGGGDRREILQRCAEALVEHAGAAFARIWILDEVRQVLELDASAGLYTHLDGDHARIRIGEYKIGRIAGEKRPHLSNDVPNDPEVSDPEWARQQGMVAFAGYPLLVEGRVVGVIGMFARHMLGEDTLRAIQDVAERIALIVERERTHRELRRRERQLAEAQRIARLGSWEWQVGSETVLWSDELYRLFGIDPGVPVTYESYVERLHADDRDRVTATIQRAVETAQGYTFEHRLVRPDGEIRHVLSHGEVETDRHGRPTRLFGIAQDITERKEAAEREHRLALERVAREEAEARRAAIEYQSYITRTITDNATAALFMMDHRGHCTHMNPAAEAMIGYTLDEIRDMPLHDAIHHLHPDGRPYPIAECPIDRALPEDFSIRAHEDVFIRKNGEFFPIVCAASPIFQDDIPVGTVVEVRDVSQEKQAERERERLLQEVSTERGRLRELFMEAPAFITTLAGPEHVFEMANEHYLRLVGQREIVGKTVAEALPEVVEQGFVDLLDRVFTTGEPYIGNEVPVLLQRAQGARPERLFVNFVYQPIRDVDGRTTGIFVHGVDVTDQVRARHEVEEKAEELGRVARALERSNRELDQFAYVASHDLKAPLRGIANLSQWIEEDLGTDLPEETAEHLRLLRGRVQRMEGLIDGILQFSRAGRVRDAVKEVAVGELLAEVLDMLSPPDGVTIATADDLPTLETERLPLQQVFMNLIGNAIKYNDAAEPRIEVGVSDAGEDFWAFHVADNGPGIAPEYHERIFGIFQTLHARDKVEGTGIGLSLVRKIVEARGGRVQVESAPGAGATFRFLWPKRPITRTQDETANE